MIKAIKTLLSDPAGRWLFVILSIFLLVSCAVGFVLDPRAFLENLLAGIATLALSVLVALVVVEWFLEHQQKRQWLRSRSFTLHAIATHLCEIAGSIFLCYHDINFKAVERIFESHSLSPNQETLKSFDLLLQELRNLINRSYKDKSTSDMAVEYYRAVRWDLAQIQNILTPRVIQSHTDQILVDRLIEFDHAQRELRHAIIAHQQAVTHSVFPCVISLIESAKGAYAAMVDNRSL